MLASGELHKSAAVACDLQRCNNALQDEKEHYQTMLERATQRCNIAQAAESEALKESERLLHERERDVTDFARQRADSVTDVCVC
jgi:vacuolar-type H+-ATPase catalytic subunit A/Vma1